MSAWPASSRITAMSAPLSARWVQKVWRRTCGARRSSGSAAACAWRATIRAMSRVASGVAAAGARQRQQQVLGRGRRAGLDPGGDRGERVLVERDGAAAAALAVADRHPPAGRAGDRPAQPRVACAAALVDVGDQQVGGLGAAQAGRAEQVQQRDVALAWRVRRSGIRSSRSNCSSGSARGSPRATL